MSQELSQRFAAIRAHYAHHMEALAESSDEWAIDPYAWSAPGTRIALTPIENALWHDIRAVDLVMYPQLPVGRFFVDFGNPAAKVAIECDGEQWHTDKSKDAARDAELKAMGWAVYRITGRECFTDTAELRDPDTGRIKLELGVARRFIQAIASHHPICRDRRDVDLDAIKARGDNRLEVSQRLLVAHSARERAEIVAHFNRPEL